MGYGGYSYEAHRAITAARGGKSTQAVFSQREIHPLMNPHGIGFRESRDSEDHPRSLAIAFALDVSGSMGTIPDLIARHEMPGFMKLLMDCGVEDPQLLFMAFTDTGSDRTPLQVGQFESTAELMDQWLTRSWLIGGGRSPFESYELPIYLAARHTKIDCWEKRREKGYLFITGDEPSYSVVGRNVVQQVFGETIPADIPLDAMIAEASERYEIFFLVPDPERANRIRSFWEPYLGRRLIEMADATLTCPSAAAIIAVNEGLAELSDVSARLTSAGTDARRAGAVQRSLEAWATNR
ncbi:MAG: VWA domain-containing protein [Sandaracinaceae bacterium]